MTTSKYWPIFMEYAFRNDATRFIKSLDNNLIQTECNFSKQGILIRIIEKQSI